jgi:hypothetical protein
MAIIVLIWRENDTADKVPRANHGFKNGLFLTKLGTKMISLFAIYTIIGTNTRSNPCCRHGWPSLYLFEGKTTQLTKRHAPIVHSKMDFSQRIWEQKWPVFLQCTQCNDPGETVHTWWRGEGFPGAARVLVGVAMVMINFHVELCVESYVFHPGTGLGKGAFPQDETHRKCCRQDIFQVADVSCLEKIVSARLGARFLNPQTWFEFWGAQNLVQLFVEMVKKLNGLDDDGK